MANIFVPRLSVNSPNPIDTNTTYYKSENNPFWTSPNDIWMPNCTAYAFGRYAEARGGFPPNRLPTGNAKTWYNNATSFKRGKTPKLGAVMCFGGTDSNDYGHVCIVEEIYADGSVRTSNSYYYRGEHGDYYDRMFFSMHRFDAVVQDGKTTYIMLHNGSPRPFQGFIYNDVVDAPYIPYSDIILSAIMGNWYGESGLNPSMWESTFNPAILNEDYPEIYAEYAEEWKRYTYTFRTLTLNDQNVGTGGYGLGQWTNVNGDTGGRLYRLYEYCYDTGNVNTKGQYELDMNGELGFFLEEAYWNDHYDGKYGSTLDEFLNLDLSTIDEFDLSTTAGIENVIKKLVEVFMHNWEGIPTASNLQNRKNQAVTFYHLIQQEKNNPLLYTQWFARATYLEPEHIEDNAMYIYFWFTNGTPNPPKVKRKNKLTPFLNAMESYNIIVL